MTVLSLRGTISTLSAVSVIIVAAITLSITLTSSLAALRDIGKIHAGVLLEVANVKTQQMFAEPCDIAESIQNYSVSRDWGWPSNNITVHNAFREAHVMAFLTSGRRSAGIITYFKDNSRYYCGPDTEEAYGSFNHLAEPERIWGLGNSPVTWDQRGFYWSNNSMEHKVPYSEAVPLSNITLWSTLSIATGFGTRNSFPGILLVEFREVFVYVPVVVPIYYRGYPRTMANVRAFTSVGIYTTALSTFLRAARGTPGTRAVALDGYGYLLGSSEETTLPFESKKKVPIGTPPPNPGCTSTDGTAGITAGAVDATMVCRTSAAAYPIDTVRAAYAVDELREAPTEGAVRHISVGGSYYFAAAARVPLRYAGLRMLLLLTMPEVDIIGDVVRNRNIAIGVTAAVVVLVAVLAFVLISLLLAPLATVAERMTRAANFEDDEAGTALSSMSEVAGLQQAYFELNDELNRIRGFVPQAVLYRNADDEEDDAASAGAKTAEQAELDNDGVESTTAGTTLHDEVRSVRTVASSRARTARSKRSRRSGNPAAGAAATSVALGLGLRQQAVSVLVANATGFTAFASASDRDGVVLRHAGTVDAVLAAVRRHNGVFDSFHGDHFVATFNAARPCAGHARQACLAALAITSEAPSTGLRLPMRAGVSTGRCLIGNLGTSDAKAFSTVGPAYTQAALLERLCGVYGCAVLAPRRTCADIAVHLRYVYVDLVRLPGRTNSGGGLTLVGVVTGPRARTGGEDEWLYVVASDGVSDMDVHNEACETLIDASKPSRATVGVATPEVTVHDSGVGAPPLLSVTRSSPPPRALFPAPAEKEQGNKVAGAEASKQSAATEPLPYDAARRFAHIRSHAATQPIDTYVSAGERFLLQVYCGLTPAAQAAMAAELTVLPA